jgi:hypothetical protein
VLQGREMADNGDLVSFALKDGLDSLSLDDAYTESERDAQQIALHWADLLVYENHRFSWSKNWHMPKGKKVR